MTREEAKKVLEDGGYLHCHAWTFWKAGMTCGSEYGCCDDTFENIEEVLGNIEFFCGGNWDEVEE